jgi:hypothetical protein
LEVCQPAAETRYQKLTGLLSYLKNINNIEKNYNSTAHKSVKKIYNFITLLEGPSIFSDGQLQIFKNTEKTLMQKKKVF